jgi:hypothetical protein
MWASVALGIALGAVCTALALAAIVAVTGRTNPNVTPSEEAQGDD